MKSEDRRHQIVSAAIDFLADGPPSELSTRAIARRVGVSQPALFRHFTSRDQILKALVAQTRSDLEGIAERVLGAPDGTEAQLGLLVRGLLEHVERRPGLPRLVFADAFPGKSGVRADVRALVAMQRALVTELVRAGQAEGVLDGGVDASLAAAALLGAVQGLILQWQLDDRKGPLASRSTGLVALWLGGVRARPGRPAAVVLGTPRVSGAGAALEALDVRPILAKGLDPLDAILAAAARIGARGLLVVTAPFRPAPLLALLGRRGFSVEAMQEGPAAWTVIVRGPGAPELHDLRELEPPEPMERMLRLADALRGDDVALARLPRFPRLLLPKLEAKGVAHQVLELADGSAIALLRRPR